MLDSSLDPEAVRVMADVERAQAPAGEAGYREAARPVFHRVHGLEVLDVDGARFIPSNQERSGALGMGFAGLILAVMGGAATGGGSIVFGLGASALGAGLLGTGWTRRKKSGPAPRVDGVYLMEAALVFRHHGEVEVVPRQAILRFSYRRVGTKTTTRLTYAPPGAERTDTWLANWDLRPLVEEWQQLSA